MQQFKTINFSCDQKEIENFSGTYDPNRSLGDIKMEIINRKYIPFQIELYLSNKKKLIDNQTLGDFPYDTFNITIRKSNNLQGQSFLKSYILQNRERSKEISVLLITNFQRQPLNDEFKIFKNTLINCYYNYDTKPMKFTDLYNNQPLGDHQFISYKAYSSEMQQQFRNTNNPEMLNIVLSKIFKINWNTVYKVVIIFTDSKQCLITQQIINLFTNGYQVIFITNNDENQQWIENQSKAFPVLCSNNIDFYDKDFIQKINKQINQTLQQIITPLNKTTIKVINDDSTKFDLMESFVRINLQDFQDMGNNVIEETMDYFIPKLEYRSIDEIITDLSKFKIRFVKDGTRKVLYSKSPIGEGACKIVYGCKIKNEDFVLKMRKNTKGFISEADLEEDIKNHLLTQEVFDNFSFQLQQKGEKIPAKFGDLFVLRNNQGRYFIIEKRYEGTDIRFNSNGGFVNDQMDHFNKIAQAFSIFSYVFSKKNLIILDLQGYVYQNNSFLWFSDPAVVTFQNNFSSTDLGVAFTDQYLAQWDAKQQIGSELLEKLGIY